MLKHADAYPEDAESAGRVAQAYRDLGDEENAGICEQRARRLRDAAVR